MRSVAVLKSPDYSRHLASAGTLPYRIDLLRDAGFCPRWSDRNTQGRLRYGPIGRLVLRSEALTTPWLQTLLTWPIRRQASVVLAMFESEGHGLALGRRLMRRGRRAPLVILSCWLAELVVQASPRRKSLYRWLYRGVDHVIVLSENQAATLERELALPRDHITVVRFGVDLDELSSVEPCDEGTVVAVGRDRGRDWRCLLAAADRSGWRVELATRPEQLAGLQVPAEVSVHGVLDRHDYLELLRRACVVALPSEVREYPTGQTVLLEAMALGKPCVVTDTPAMREYVTDETTALLVAPGDERALRAAVDRLLDDHALRERLGTAAKEQVLAWGGARAMWTAIAATLDRTIARRDG